MEGVESSNSRVGLIDLLDGNTSLDMDRRTYIPYWLVTHLVPEDGHASSSTGMYLSCISSFLAICGWGSMEVHADDATVGSPHHTKWKIHIHTYYIPYFTQL